MIQKSCLLDSKRMKTESQRDICTFKFNEASFTVAKHQKSSKHLFTDEWIKKMWFICTMHIISLKKRKLTRDEMDKSQGHYTQGNKPVTEGKFHMIALKNDP